MNYEENERIDVTMEFLRMLAKLQLTKEQQRIVIDFFHTYLTLTKREEMIVLNKIKADDNTERMLEITNPYIEHGKDIGRKEGHREGYTEGRKLGKSEAKREIASKMLSKGFSIEEIKQLTALSEKEIERLRQK